MSKNGKAAGRAGQKRRLLTQAAPARVAGIGDAVVIKDAELSFLCRPTARCRAVTSTASACTSTTAGT